MNYSASNVGGGTVAEIALTTVMKGLVSKISVCWMVLTVTSVDAELGPFWGIIMITTLCICKVPVFNKHMIGY